MNVNFKWSVGDVVKMPFFGGNLVPVNIVARIYREDKDKCVIEYATDMFYEGHVFTQEEIEEFN